MKKYILFLMTILTISICSSCVPTSAAVYTDSSAYDNDALYVGYEIVWVNNLPYWHRNNVFIPYHHTHVLPYNRHYVIERRAYRPHVTKYGYSRYTPNIRRSTSIPHNTYRHNYHSGPSGKTHFHSKR